MSTINKIINLLDNKGLTQKQLTDYLGIEKSVFTTWKSGKSQSYNKYLSKIAEFLNVSIDYLLRETLTLDFVPHEDDDYLLRCPICNYDYVHFTRVLDVDFGMKKSYGVALEFSCEAEHKFYLVAESFKGNTYLVKIDEKDLKHSLEDIYFEDIPLPLDVLEEREKNAGYLKKYRTLDGYGKKAIDDLLNTEYQRCVANDDNKPKVISLPMAELKASAGTGQWLGNDEYKTWVNVLDTPEARKANVVINVAGDSMMPDYNDGDKVLVKLNAEPVENEIGIFIIDNNGYIKKFGKDKLVSLNKDYPDIPFTDNMDIRFIGKVIGKAQIIY